MNKLYKDQTVIITVADWFANQNKTPRTFETDLKYVTERAILIAYDGRDVWIPKSVIEQTREVKKTINQTVEIENNKIKVIAHFSAFDVCEEIPGGRKWGAVWHFPLSPIVVKSIYNLLIPKMKEYGPVEATQLDNIKINVDSIDQAQKAKEVETPDPVPLTKLPAWDHQARAFWFAHPLNSCMLALGMGCGKSKIILDLIQNRGHKKVLIVCPKNVIQTWVDEPAKHVHDSFKYKALGMNQKNWTVKRKQEAAAKFLEECESEGKAAIISINYESVWRDPFGSWALGAGFDLVVGDESHKIKSPNGQASKWFHKMGARVPYRILSSGTPMGQTPLDIYSQYKFLDPGIFGSSFTKFKRKFCIMHELFPSNFIKMNPQYEDEFNKRFYSICFKADTEDVLDLPPAIHNEVRFDLEKKTRKHYDELLKDFNTTLKGLRGGDGDEGKEITVTNALTKILRLQQLTGGFLTDEDKEVIEVSNEKQKALEEILEGIEGNENIVVFARFAHDLEKIKEATKKSGRRYLEISGRNKNSVEDLKEFKEGNPGVVLGVQIQAGGAGIDLTRARYVVYYSVGHSVIDYQQSLKRAHRPGQERTTFFYHLIANESIDIDVYKSLAHNKKIIDYLIENDLTLS